MGKKLMKKAIVFFLNVTIMLTMTGFTSVYADVKGEETTVIKVFHTNDTHSRMGTTTDNKGNEYYPLAKFKSYIDNSEADGKIILDAGDTYHGQAFATLSNGSSIAELLKTIGYDAMTSGNHDYNYGYERLLELEKMSNTPILALNVEKAGEKLFKNHYIIKEVNGIKIGIFGLATPETARKTGPNNIKGLSFGNLDTITYESQQMVNQLKENGADVVILVAHMGIEPSSDIKSTDIADKVTGIDLIIDGHSHSDLSLYEDYNAKHKTKIASTGEYLNNFGEVTINVNNETKEKEIDLKEIETASVQSEDENIKELLKGLNTSVDVLKQQVVGYTPIRLDGEREDVRYKQTNLGNVLTSAMKDETGADIAMLNGGAIRTSIDKGDITKGKIVDVLPFGNYVITKKVKGSDIVSMLYKALIEGSGSFTQFAGMTVSVTKFTEKLDNGFVETRYNIDNIKVNGNPIDVNKEYIVATNDYLASGGDCYSEFASYPELNEYSALDEILIKYLSNDGESKILAADKEKRLIETNHDNDENNKNDDDNPTVIDENKEPVQDKEEDIADTADTNSYGILLFILITSSAFLYISIKKKNA